MEKDPQARLRSNLAQLEPGLRVVDDGKECRVAAGFIDILAEVQAGYRVVIELKASFARPEALTQLLGYVGTVDAGPAGVRGLLVALESHPKLLHAVKALPNVALREYRCQFNFRGPSK